LASPQKSNYIPTLDGLRAVAILMVIVSHAVSARAHPGIVSVGHVGVLIFFALSGYLITSRLLNEYNAHGRISLRNFYLRRVFRILPPALFYLLTVSTLTLTGVVVCSWATIRSAVLLYTNYAEVGDFGWRVGHFWSLSVEEHFYLFWPALLMLFGVRKGWRTAASIAVTICIWRILDDRFHFLAWLFHDAHLAVDSYRTDLIADVLLWGCCLAFFLRPPFRNAIGPIASSIIAVATMILLVTLGVLRINHVTMLEHLLPTICLGAVVAAPNTPIGRFLELPPMRFIGRLSYGLYIWQQLFLGGWGSRLPLLFALPAILACAFFSFVVVEQTSIRFGRKLIRRRTISASQNGSSLFKSAPAPNVL
jgi:peptidoglycan/LPS O-acetylase OafA/YrhL